MEITAQRDTEDLKLHKKLEMDSKMNLQEVHKKAEELLT